MRLDVYRRSRGKGLTDLPLLPVRKPMSPLWWLMVVLLLVGCAPVAIKTDAYHIRPAVLVITTDAALIERACWNAKRYADGVIVGCYVPTSHPPAIYCPPNDAAVCWHELFDHHVNGGGH